MLTADRRPTLGCSRSTPACCSPRRWPPGSSSRSASASRSRCSTPRSPGEPWTAEHCCGEAKVDALERALADVDAWITGIRREQAPTRAGGAQARARRAPRDLEAQPARRLDREGHLALHLRARSALQPAARSGLRLDRLRPVHAARARAARAAGPGRTRPSAGSTLTTLSATRSGRASSQMNPFHYELSHLESPRGRVDPHLPRGRRRVRAAGAAVQRRQGLDRAAAAGREGVPARAGSRSRSCTSTPGTTSPR